MLRFTTIRSSARAADRPRGRERTLGQSLVEFALVLPILLFLTLIALDFGRVYLGYINLQNMARIAANFAANNPTAWDGTVVANDAVLKTKYKNQIIADAAGDQLQAGRHERRRHDRRQRLHADLHRPQRQRQDHRHRRHRPRSQIGCSFQVITPGIANIVGGTVKVAAASTLPGQDRDDRRRHRRRWRPAAPPNAAFSGNGVITRLAPTRSPASHRSTSSSATPPVATRPPGLWTFPDPLGDDIVRPGPAGSTRSRPPARTRSR